MSTTTTPEILDATTATPAADSPAATAETTTAATPPPVDEWQTALEAWADELQAECTLHIEGGLREPSGHLWRLIYGTLLAICSEPAEALKKPSWRMIAAGNKLATAAASPFCDSEGRYRGVNVRGIHSFDLTRPALDLVDSIRDRRNGPPTTITVTHKLQTVEELEKSGCSWDSMALALGLHRILGHRPTVNEWYDIRRGEHPTVTIPTTRTTTHPSKPWPDLPQRLHNVAWAVVVLAKVLEIPDPPQIEDLL